MMPCLVWGCLLHPYDYFIVAAVILGIAMGYVVCRIIRR